MEFNPTEIASLAVALASVGALFYALNLLQKSTEEIHKLSRVLTIDRAARSPSAPQSVAAAMLALREDIRAEAPSEPESEPEPDDDSGVVIRSTL